MSTSRFKFATLFLAIALAAVASSQDIRVAVNGEAVDFEGAGPMTSNGRVLVPLRGVFEQMGAYVDWNAATRTVTAERSGTNVELRIGDREATVDGRILELDSPAQISRGRTMVPLRFLSESLGASVEWIAPTRTVEISTSRVINPSRTDPIPTRYEVAIDSGTVIPVKLEDELSSQTARLGDRFWMSMRDVSGTAYAGLPEGTRIEGVVAGVHARERNNPGLLELNFKRIVLPDGRTATIDGSLIGLDSTSVVRNSDGVYTARRSKKDDRIVFAGYGAGAGLLVGLLTKKPLEGAVLGGVLGYLFGEVQRSNERPADVILRRGTEFGVRLDSDLVIRSGRK
ncbi:MAG: hypothetical protein IT203_10950 [Fimbriimonadaceae bacterium]|nr:hypothetical protein [Fimbriimonadaceae bacterium]